MNRSSEADSSYTRSDSEPVTKEELRKCRFTVSGDDRPCRAERRRDGSVKDWNGVMLDTYPWIRGEGGRLFRDKVAEWADKMGLWYNRIAIKNTSSQWASCSVNKNLSFSWKLFVLPETLVDYIIIHELTHLKHMDHSKEFWSDVEVYYPEYKKAKKELEDYV